MDPNGVIFLACCPLSVHVVCNFPFVSVVRLASLHRTPAWAPAQSGWRQLAGWQCFPSYCASLLTSNEDWLSGIASYRSVSVPYIFILLGRYLLYSHKSRAGPSWSEITSTDSFIKSPSTKHITLARRLIWKLRMLFKSLFKIAAYGRGIMTMAVWECWTFKWEQCPPLHICCIPTLACCLYLYTWAGGHSKTNIPDIMYISDFYSSSFLHTDHETIERTEGLQKCRVL